MGILEFKTEKYKFIKSVKKINKNSEFKFMINLDYVEGYIKFT
jgi:hypothetical protein